MFGADAIDLHCRELSADKIIIPNLDSRPDLATTRLSLRRPAERDEQAVVSIVGDWDVARRLARVPHPYGPDDARFFLERVVPAEWVWAITLRREDRLISADG